MISLYYIYTAYTINVTFLFSPLLFLLFHHPLSPPSFPYLFNQTLLPLYQCRNTPRLREFAEIFAVPACEFGDAIRHGFKAEPPATPHLTTEEGDALLCCAVPCPVLSCSTLLSYDLTVNMKPRLTCSHPRSPVPSTLLSSPLLSFLSCPRLHG